MALMRERLRNIQESEAFGQLVRYLMAGGLTTALYALIYSALAGLKLTSEQVANLVAYLLVMASGYVIHSRWSFRGHRAAASQATWRFVVVALISYALNTSWVWLLTDEAMFGGPWWWPLIPVVFVTPFFIFTLNRVWVFS
jgi:putative flippase GtrA